MLPGKKYKPEDILQIAWRYRWLIVVPFLLVSIGTVLAARVLPDKYRSSTLILLVPQKIPESYVRSTVTSTIEDRLQTISQQIMSRTRLERIILEQNLYAKERPRGIMEDIVERMRKDVTVNVVRGDAFSVSYTSEDPRMAMKVADLLSTAFMDESRSERSVQAEATSDFLKNQLEDARRQLTEIEQKLAEYQRRHAGELPTEREANLQALNNAQMQVQQLVESINRDRDRRYLLEKQLGDLQAEVAPVVTAPTGTTDPRAIQGATAAEQVEFAKKQLQALEMRLTPEHADVKRMKRIIEDLEKKVQAEALEKPLSPDGSSAAVLTPEERLRGERIKDFQLQMEAVDRQIAGKLSEEQRIRGVINVYQGRLEATPTRESELTQLTRDYDIQRKTYDSLLAKSQDARVSANMENRAIGEQFRVLDPARLPERPFSPNRPFINLLGALAGLGLGMGLAGLMEYRDSTFRTDDEVVSVLALPVLAMIPVMMTTTERRRARRRRVRMIVAGAATFVIAAAVLAWRFDLVNRFLR